MDNQQDSYNKGGFLAFLFSVVFCLVFFIYIAFVHKGVDLKEVTDAQPEQQMAGEGAASQDLWESSDAIIAHGQKVYKLNCALCHGDSGKGDGPAGMALKPPPRNLVEGKWKQGGTSIALFKTLQNGVPGTTMAAFKHLPKKDRWGLVHYIRSITQNKEADDLKALEEFAAAAE
jgi:mono/diheme cytochrome c family protein